MAPADGCTFTAHHKSESHRSGQRCRLRIRSGVQSCLQARLWNATRPLSAGGKGCCKQLVVLIAPERVTTTCDWRLEESPRVIGERRDRETHLYRPSGSADMLPPPFDGAGAHVRFARSPA